ncbi:MAG: hypothetical protein R3F44_07435 [Candidatus Competibacteraceae bacterium]
MTERRKKVRQRLSAANVVFRNTTEAAAILDENGCFTMVEILLSKP